MALKPLQDRIVIKVIEDTEQTAGGIFIPDSAKEKPQKGEVVAVGLGKVGENGEREPMDVKVGDVICILEAMKLENEVVADCNGVITSIAVTKGTAVKNGQLIAKIG